ncbi:MAG: hypothetical protein KJ057_12535 [Phycisphaerae bacterium]|nr:MAG: hypothetical protein EDS66_15470 [Planctomycetota bacterium]KAB2950018.1 MAG: hypothetical protein F9K17_00885 [Phycisphaerae bacterium]MBE7458335.1 hypothetical protein [Planctomycetia bacterium]MCK6465781.1 hypothetical protein [Phycisphaerae bacterium]MCL4719292.1 hypothetical protein [Phycisphaerae bacterium]
MAKHQFGGSWTEQKLERIRRCLGASTTIFRNNPEEWSAALTRALGTDLWREAFYAKKQELTLFGPEVSEKKDATLDVIGAFFIDRLKSIFAGVAGNSLSLKNSTGSPIYLLCFAAGNLKGARTAVKIAQDILAG